LYHFILDMIPHGDEHLGKKFFGMKLREQPKDDFRILALYGIIDSFFMAVFLIFLFKTFDFATNDNTVWGIIGGILPDILVAFYKLKPNRWLKWLFDFHKFNHGWLINRLNADIPLKIGVIMQTTFMIILVWLIYIF